jgi:hypothetical protein
MPGAVIKIENNPINQEFVIGYRRSSILPNLYPLRLIYSEFLDTLFKLPARICSGCHLLI